jgi:hypothetical protein
MPEVRQRTKRFQAFLGGGYKVGAMAIFHMVETANADSLRE